MIKNSVEIWAFGPAVTRFVPPGYQREDADVGTDEDYGAEIRRHRKEARAGRSEA